MYKNNLQVVSLQAPNNIIEDCVTNISLKQMWLNNPICGLMWYKKKTDYNWMKKRSPCAPRMTKDCELPAH